MGTVLLLITFFFLQFLEYLFLYILLRYRAIGSNRTKMYGIAKQKLWSL